MTRAEGGWAVGDDGPWRVHQFKVTDTLVVTKAGMIEYLVVAGGGGGGTSKAGADGGSGVVIIRYPI